MIIYPDSDSTTLRLQKDYFSIEKSLITPADRANLNIPFLQLSNILATTVLKLMGTKQLLLQDYLFAIQTTSIAFDFPTVFGNRNRPTSLACSKFPSTTYNIHAEDKLDNSVYGKIFHPPHHQKDAVESQTQLHLFDELRIDPFKWKNGLYNVVTMTLRLPELHSGTLGSSRNCQFAYGPATFILRDGDWGPRDP